MSGLHLCRGFRVRVQLGQVSRLRFVQSRVVGPQVMEGDVTGVCNGASAEGASQVGQAGTKVLGQHAHGIGRRAPFKEVAAHIGLRIHGHACE